MQNVLTQIIKLMNKRYSVQIPEHKLIDKKVYYVIKIFNLEGGEPKVV
jgi:hypothetical protein